MVLKGKKCFEKISTDFALAISQKWFSSSVGT